MSFFAKYNHLLATKPLLTNVITTGFLFGTGDLLAQSIEHRKDGFDGARLSRAIIYGAIIFAPLGDRWYRILNGVKVGNSKIVNTAARVGLDQLVFAPFIGIPLYYSAMTAMEGGATHNVRKKLNDNWWKTLTANWTVWPAVQTVNFAFVPVQLRLLVVNTISIAWNCFLLMQLNSAKTEDVYVLE